MQANQLKENTNPTPMLNVAWAYSRKVIFPMQPLAHWLTHVGEGIVDHKYIKVNKCTKNIRQ